jgi:hypothetical protein
VICFIPTLAIPYVVKSSIDLFPCLHTRQGEILLATREKNR